MKTYTLATLLVIALVLAACQPATPIPPTATLTAEPPTSTPTSTPTITPTYTPTITSTPTITATPTVGPGGFPRRFHVEGNAFVDQFGQKMIFRGMASPDPTLMSACTSPNKCGDPNMPAFNKNYYQAFASWGPNILRVPITPFSLYTYGLDATLRALDQTIAWAGENHMYVIIDFHSVGWFPDNWFGSDGSRTTIEEWTGFWKTVSSRYANNDVVAFYELFSEPALPWDLHPYYPYPKKDWLTWKGLVETLVNDTIRPNDPDKIVLVGGLLSAYDLSYVAGAPIADSSNNVAYSTHPYPSGFENQHLSWDSAFGNLSKKYAVFATEYGYDSPDINIGGSPYHQAIMDYLEAHQISWTAWIFAATWSPIFLKDNQTFETTESGTFFRSRLLELNLPSVPTPTLPMPKPTATGRPGNLAYGKAVTASSIEWSGNPAEDAVDGDSTTRWSSGYSDPQWIKVDLGAIYHINRVVLNWEAAYGVAYKIQISSDGSNWETIYSTTNGDGNIDDLSVSGSGRYVRMYGTSRAVIGGGSFGYSLYEFEAYGVP